MTSLGITDTARLPTGAVTFLFTDIEGSTKLWEEHPQAMKAALADHDALLRRQIEAHSGHVFKTVGDAFYAAFPAAGEALAAALAIQRALRDCGLSEKVQDEPAPDIAPLPQSAIPKPQLRVRMALHTGAAEQRDDDYFGPSLSRVARILAAGHGGQILLSLPTAESVREALPQAAALRDLGEHRLKDLARPERIIQLLHPDLRADFPPLRSLEAFAHNLPVQLTSFIGREPEMAEVKRLLGTTRLLTLTGAGGCGKTRLALQVAADLVEQYPEGVWLVELAPLADPGLVPQTVASTLGVREEPGRLLIETLANYLRPRSLLLVLDNCEHLITACAQLAEGLLRRCPQVHILATSREALGISGETVSRVPSLSLPEVAGLHHGSLNLESAIAQSESCRLFCERAAAALPDFTITAQAAAAIAQVCRCLDGIPLAIELAAARVRVMTVDQIAQRLDDPFRLLAAGSRTAPPRQQTLRALIDWSFHLLQEAEQVLLRRLSVFAGGWTLAAAEAVCSGGADERGTCLEEWEILELLARLVETSLVIHDPPAATSEASPNPAAGDGEGRYRLLETVRQYSRERLLEAGEEAAVREQHARCFLRLAEEAEPELIGAGQARWLSRLEEEHDNLRAALGWSQSPQGDPEVGLRLCGALLWFWSIRGYFSEGRQWTERALAAGAQASPYARVRARDTIAHLAYYQGDSATARPIMEEDVTVWRALGDQRGLAYALRALGWVTLDQGHHGEARSLIEESRAIYQQLGDRNGITRAINHQAYLAALAGDYENAQSLWEECLRLAQEMGDRWMTGWILSSLSQVATYRGDFPGARLLLEQSLLVRRELKDRRGLAACLEGVAALAGRHGQAERAVRLFAAAEAWREILGAPLHPHTDWRLDRERHLEAARAALGEEAFAAAWAQGRALTWEQAVALALENGDG